MLLDDLGRDFRFQLHFCAKPYSRRPLASTSARRGHGCVASVAPFAVPLTALACYLARPWHSSPRDDDSSTISLLSLVHYYPFGSGSAATLRNMLPKQREMPFGQQQPVITRMLHQPSGGLHQAMLQTRQRPVIQFTARFPSLIHARPCSAYCRTARLPGSPAPGWRR